jgi:acetyltransferase-like isoleucine patch superfamily enzyme
MPPGNILSGTSQHAFDDPSLPIAAQPAPGRRTLNIGRDAWNGSNAVICNEVGNRCVIGAGSVVVREVDHNTIVAGNPAIPVPKI